jgi:hypothetical protein
VDPQFSTQNDSERSGIFPDSSLPHHSETFEQWINNFKVDADCSCDLRSDHDIHFGEINEAEAAHVIGNSEPMDNSIQMLTCQSKTIDDNILEASTIANRLTDDNTWLTVRSVSLRHCQGPINGNFHVK